jgi:hypothetical protein
MPVPKSNKINGTSLPCAEENFLFRDVCRCIWPKKTDRELARIGGASDRAAREWLAGRIDPPASVVVAIMVAITQSYH